MFKHVLKVATIIRNGAILMGKNVVCDAHVKRPIRIVTHIHWDHIIGLEKSLKECEHVLMTPISQEFIKILRGKHLNPEARISPLPYYEKFFFDNEEITFFPAGHIFGSAQAMMKTKDNLRILYTGDFKYPPAKPITTDILITEATYGNPKNVRKFKDLIEDSLINLINESLERKPVLIFGFHGKLQRILSLLHKEKLKSPVLMPERIYKMAKACERCGVKFEKYFSINSKEATKLINFNEPFIALLHAKSYKNPPLNGIKIKLTGWEFEKAVRRVGKDNWIVAMSDHSDFEQLLEFIEKCEPKYVITDNYRVGDAFALAKEIERKLKIPARALPP